MGKLELPELPSHSENKIFNYLKDVTDVASLSPKERARYERNLKRYRGAYTLNKTYEYILEMSKNVEARGAVEKAIAISQNLKKMNLSLADISGATGLSVKEIDELKLIK
jgi:hypothetical protein